MRSQHFRIQRASHRSLVAFFSFWLFYIDFPLEIFDFVHNHLYCSIVQATIHIHQLAGHQILAAGTPLSVTVDRLTAAVIYPLVSIVSVTSGDTRTDTSTISSIHFNYLPDFNTSSTQLTT